MDQGWEVSEEHYLEHLMQNPPLNLKRQGSQQLEKPTVVVAQESPKTRMRFRTTSMPKLDESNKPSSPTKKSVVEVQPKVEQQVKQQASPIIIKTPIRQQKFQLYPQRISLRSTLYQTPGEEGSPIKLGRTLQPKQFNPILSNVNDTHYNVMKGQTRSVKSASMSNLLNNEDRLLYKKKIEDLVFKMRPQRNAIPYKLLQMLLYQEKSKNE
ncbi:unnamed protein product (macronuclear) [Paramecium tetraurelia]|uniref:BESS domain-containing protein n=1 Tax=Paramecium tetraurelia TaxID=5888 RepID=A0BXA8_PARTE|nr:uncharacterized protein GSPATT00033028001 [Paramecium tetraurelia]CAK63175.1 unnamed protein product [Paramecium tetraurelia]|eukprot:XP_001430573.1 hypothetical protein (macronuclear) [Paramecium tetraurelia strain d4-2]